MWAVNPRRKPMYRAFSTLDHIPSRDVGVHLGEPATIAWIVIEGETFPWRGCLLSSIDQMPVRQSGIVRQALAILAQPS
jgi:hypothetical protein